MDLISIIVPVYNVEKFLNRCVESIAQQTYKYLEIILVDDGSLDKCPEICDEWSKKDERIKVVHKKNGGLSDARNVGLAIATGEYIAFVDSDDWIHSEFIEQMYLAIKTYKTNIAACDIRWVYTDEINEEITLPTIKCYSTEQALETLINGEIFRAVVWNKLYHKMLLKDESFEVGRYHEDEFFTYRILAKSKKIVYVNSKLYFYFQREGSIMNSISCKHLDVLDAHVERINFLCNRYPKLYESDKKTFCIACVHFYQETFKMSNKEKKACRDKISSCRKKITFSISEWKRYSLKDLIYITGSRLFVGLLSRILLVKKETGK